MPRGLSRLSTFLSPPYGVYFLGQSLTDWGMFALFILFLAEVWWEGRQIGKLVNESLLQTIPGLGLLSGLSLIAQGAQDMGMEWSGFLGPLRPVRTQ